MIDLVVGQIEEELETVAVDLITETAAEYLESFALETELLTGVFVESALTAVQTVNDGLRPILDAKIFGTAVLRCLTMRVHWPQVVRGTSLADWKHTLGRGDRR